MRRKLPKVRGASGRLRLSHSTHEIVYTLVSRGMARPETSRPGDQLILDLLGNYRLTHWTGPEILRYVRGLIDRRL